MTKATLPLGVDIGSTRVRVAEDYETPCGPRIRAVAVREAPSGSASSGGLSDPDYVAALVEDALRELRTRERRCVCAIGEPEAQIRKVAFPEMSWRERERAASFEAARHIAYPIDEAVVRVHPVDRKRRTCAIGIARAAVVRTRTSALRKAGLRVVSMDHEAYALSRVLPDFDAIVDVGLQRTNLHVLADDVPVTLVTFAGGADVTRGIERDLLIDESSAEKRKRILGTAGAGERARSALTTGVCAMIGSGAVSKRLTRIALVGNGARLHGLAEDLEKATGATVELPVAAALQSEHYPEDVVRAAAPDWTLSAGLAVWGSAV